jgi:hypothetical protein
MPATTTPAIVLRGRNGSSTASIWATRSTAIIFFGSYAEVSSRIGFPFLQDGFSWQASGRYRHDLPPRCDYEHYITGGFDFKQTNTNLEFNAINFFESTADIAQLTFGYHGQLVRDRKSLVMGADVYISPGEFSPGNFDRDHRRLRAGAEAEYVYSRMYAELQLPVSCRLTFVSRITGQISEAPILPVEQLGFGGFDTIRGYDMRDINADSGYILNLELRTVPKPLGLQCDDQIQYLAFYDRGDALSRTVGSGKGVTTVLAKNDVIVTGRSSQAQIGFNGGSATGDIRVDAGRDVIVTALNAAAIAQIGHGGFEADANFSGNIAVLAGGDVNFESGANDEAYVQLGHGGIRSQGTFSGDINVSAGSISFTGGDGFGAYARLGHGGDNSEGNRTGNILVSSSGNLTFSGGMGQNAYAQLGHGGNEGDGDFMGTIDVTAVGLTFQGGTLNDTYAQLGHGGDNADGNHSGMITVNASGVLLFQAGFGSDSYAQLGHGGNDVDGTLTGNISVTAMNDITFSGGIGFEANAQLGHGGVFAFGDRSGDITINHANNLIFTGGEGRESYAQLGHGGTVGFGTQCGDITITRANNLVFRGGEGFFAYAQLGHGGVGVDGEQSGSISILQANDLIVSGGAGENAYAQLGHGGTAVETESEDQPFGGFTLSNQTGNISVRLVGSDLFLTGGSGPGAYSQLRHGAAGGNGASGQIIGNINVIIDGSAFLVGNSATAPALLGHATTNTAAITGNLIFAIDQINPIADNGGRLFMNQFSAIDMGGAPNQVRIFGTRRLGNVLADGAVINGVVVDSGLPPGTFTGDRRNPNVEFTNWNYEQWGPAPNRYTLAQLGPFTAPFTFFFLGEDTIAPQVFPLPYDRFVRYSDYANSIFHDLFPNGPYKMFYGEWSERPLEDEETGATSANVYNQ